MRGTSHIAAMHTALWSFDRWYRLAWYVWPVAAVLLISGWICIDKASPKATFPWAKPVASPAGSFFVKPTASPPANQIKTSPILPNGPEALRNDVATCLSNGLDLNLNPQIEACTRLIQSGRANDSQLASAYGRRGFLQRLSQPDRALDDFNSALKIQADSPFVLTHRAFIYMARNRSDEAMADLNKAIGLFPPEQASLARFYRGYAYFKARDYRHAKEDLDESIKLNSANPEKFLTRGDVEKELQQYDEALRDFDEFSKRTSNDPRGLIGRSAVLEATDRPQEALTTIESAIAMAPNNSAALTARDRLLAKRDKP